MSKGEVSKERRHPFQYGGNRWSLGTMDIHVRRVTVGQACPICALTAIFDSHTEPSHPSEAPCYRSSQVRSQLLMKKSRPEAEICVHTTYTPVPAYLYAEKLSFATISRKMDDWDSGRNSRPAKRAGMRLISRPNCWCSVKPWFWGGRGWRATARNSGASFAPLRSVQPRPPNPTS